MGIPSAALVALKFQLVALKFQQTQADSDLRRRVFKHDEMRTLASSGEGGVEQCRAVSPLLRCNCAATRPVRYLALTKRSSEAASATYTTPARLTAE